MSYFLCPACYMLGYCKRLRTPVVSDRDINNPEWVRDLRNFGYSLGVSDVRWHEFVSNHYRDYRGSIIKADGSEIFLDMGEFERPGIREWFRDFVCTPCPPEMRPRVRIEARERVRVLGTILKARYPAVAQSWGVRPSNDNVAPTNF